MGDGNIIETVKQQNQLKAFECVDFLGQNLYACKLKVQKNEKKMGGRQRNAFNRDCAVLLK